MVEATYIGVSSGFDFSQKGDYNYTSVVCGSTEPHNRYQKDSTLYDIITSGYEIAHSVKGLSVFLNEADLFPVPINGFLRVPDKEAGSPPSPLALIIHVKLFGIWNETSGHPLEGKVDMENVQAERFRLRFKGQHIFR